MPEINSLSYWDSRFGSGDWEKKGGELQTRAFAESQVKYFTLPGDFSGVIVDFGCGEGDAIPVYKNHFPKAKIIGVDFSIQAIEKCRKKYGTQADFVCGDHHSVPQCDVIIASNIFEHLPNDMEIAGNLRSKCRKLYITVPYLENIHPGEEHINRYDKDSFADLNPVKNIIFRSRGWSQYGKDLYYHTIFKNIFRIVARKPIKVIRKQIMFIFE